MIARPVGLEGIIATFGDPRPYVLRPVEWEARMLALVELPQPLPYAYRAQLITRIRAHRLVAVHLVDTLMQARAVVPPARLTYGGCYAWRPKRSNGSEFSTHTWGIAVDLEPLHNPMGRPWKDDGLMLHPKVIEIFEAAGWEWGGRWRRPDAMHFQFASGY